MWDSSHYYPLYLFQQRLLWLFEDFMILGNPVGGSLSGLSPLLERFT